MNGSGIGYNELLLLVGVAGVAFFITAMTTRRWLWTVGLVGCVAVGVINTPADPMSAIILATQCCGMYLLSGFAWNIGRDPRAISHDSCQDTY